MRGQAVKIGIARLFMIIRYPTLVRRRLEYSGFFRTAIPEGIGRRQSFLLPLQWQFIRQFRHALAYAGRNIQPVGYAVRVFGEEEDFTWRLDAL